LFFRSLARFLILTLACVVLVLLSPQRANAADGAATDQKPESITRDYSYDIGQDAPTIEQRITDEEGTVYSLREISDPVPESTGIPERHFVMTAQRPITPELESQGMTAVRSWFDETLDLDTGDYAGILRLQSLSTEPVYRSVEEQIERTIVYPGLLSEDVLQLPEYENFTVSSDEDRDATVTSELKRVAVAWAVTGFDEDGRPAVYEASVIFRGTQRRLVLDYHIATATYAGSVPAKPYRETIRATYGLESVPEAQELPIIRPVTAPEEEAPLAAAPLVPASSLVPLPLAIAGGAVVVLMLLALLLLLYFFVYCNARLVKVAESGKRSVLIRRHLRVVKSEAVFKIDPSFRIYRRDMAHLIVLGRRLVAKQGQLLVLWGDRMILRVALTREIDVTAELIRTLQDGLGVIVEDEADELEAAVSVAAADAVGAVGADDEPVLSGRGA
jgi:hypothetical protein